jgi:hypothetical protein
MLAVSTAEAASRSAGDAVENKDPVSEIAA